MGQKSQERSYLPEVETLASVVPCDENDLDQVLPLVVGDSESEAFPVVCGCRSRFCQSGCQLIVGSFARVIVFSYNDEQGLSTGFDGWS